MLRSSERIQREIRLRSRIAALAAEAGADRDDPWDDYFLNQNTSGLAIARTELREVGQLDWALDGVGVYGNAVALRRLAQIVGPLGQSLRRTARDVLFLEGGGTRVPGVDLGDLIEPVVTGTYAGSFGLKIAGSPVDEQLTFDGSLFERSAARVVDVFRATLEQDAPGAVLSSLVGLRQRTLDGLKSLAHRLIEGGATSEIRWMGGEPFRVLPSQAEVIEATIQDAEPTETTKSVVAVLELGSVSGQFHLVEPQSAGKPIDYRGKVEEGAEADLNGIPIGATVRALLVVLQLDSPLLDKPKPPTYLLREISLVD